MGSQEMLPFKQAFSKVGNAPEGQEQWQHKQGFLRSLQLNLRAIQEIPPACSHDARQFP